MPLAHRTATIDGLHLHWLEAGEGPVVLLLHGWPTSSFLWREVIPPLARHRRVIALDLPGFGRSDKPADAPYSFAFFDRVLERFVDVLELGQVELVVHDLGGPIGLHWAARHPGRVRALGLLNTLVYPEIHPVVAAFVLAGRVPILRDVLTSTSALGLAMPLGVGDRRRMTAEVIRAVQEPFLDPAARRGLIATMSSLEPRGMVEIARWLPTFRGPVRVIYGAKDRVLVDIARTVSRLERDLPQAQVTCFADCGHFLQEERGTEIGEQLAAFFSRDGATLAA
ncbi:alpha/beta fold hydrolase [Sandaracinus amylolyticus]|uniref:alpha/beta fold hydrolase n=1 Tax=Sandaracinus amylolyticus TaxID=927083 RepID=UPI001F18CF41|nr:alpha/beta fold hydrolase [Sandaracinus amylolyticus]UJR86067.1 Hypothetical protein I5071_81480 [Sandaracinus amylolyticus]